MLASQVLSTAHLYFSTQRPLFRFLKHTHASALSRALSLSPSLSFLLTNPLYLSLLTHSFYLSLYLLLTNPLYLSFIYSCPHIVQAFPHTPWVFIFRDPVEVLASYLKNIEGTPASTYLTPVFLLHFFSFSHIMLLLSSLSLLYGSFVAVYSTLIRLCVCVSLSLVLQHNRTSHSLLLLSFLSLSSQLRCCTFSFLIHETLRHPVPSDM